MNDELAQNPNLFDALVLLRLHFIIIIILFQTTFLQQREQWIGYK